jgi:hypothetical protein
MREGARERAEVEDEAWGLLGDNGCSPEVFLLAGRRGGVAGVDIRLEYGHELGSLEI